MNDPSGFSVGVDFPRILDTLATRIYDNQFAFLRENVQNAIDAIRIQAVRDGRAVDAGYRVDIRVKGSRCEISDTGNGMTLEELRMNFWTMGASGKNTAEAREAGCIGTFGIGGFANFGVCSRLTVVSRTKNCQTAHETSLSRSDFDTTAGVLPTVRYRETDAIKEHGTTVIAEADVPFDEPALFEYISQFVTYVREQIYFNDKRIPARRMSEIGENYSAISQSLEAGSGDVAVTFTLFKDEGDNLAASIQSARVGEIAAECSGFVRLVAGSLRVFRRGFKLCEVAVNSRIGVSGSLDTQLAKPTAGRDTLNAESLAQINQLFHAIEAKARDFVTEDEDLLASHIRLLPDIVSSSGLSRLDRLKVSALNGETYSLGEIKQLAVTRRVLYSLSHQRTPAAEVIQAKGDIIVAVSPDRTRRQVEVRYLTELCRAIVFDNLIERLEPYERLDEFERTLLFELEIAIKKLFSPPSFLLLPGRLTLNVPIHWSHQKEGERTVVYVDTRHGEFEKLRPLGYTPLLWSMIEAFSREYLGDSLRQRSTKFFGTGAINLEAFAKSHAELWELVPSDIETSMLEPANSERRARTHSYGTIEIVRAQDITEVRIPEPATPQDEPDRPPGKLLRVLDQTGKTGLTGYYIRIPTSASKAFGEIIRSFSNFAVLWFANRITWSGSDNADTAFLFHVTLSRMIGGMDPHGAIELDSARLQNYRDQIYFFIPPSFQDYLVPNNDTAAIKVSVTHELVDLGRSRAWTSQNAPRDATQ